MQTEIYKLLAESMDRAVERIRAETGFKDELQLFFFYSTSYGKPSAKLTLGGGSYGVNKIEVEGRDLDAMTDEFIRRVGFKREQEALLIGGPIVDSSAENIEK